MSVDSPPPPNPHRKADWAVHVALGAAIIIAGAWLFGGIAPEWLNAKPVARLDLQTATWLHEHAAPALTGAMVWVSAFHGTAGILVLAAGAGVLLWIRRDAPGLLRLVLAVPGGLLLNVAVKEAVHRARPHYFDSPVQALTSYSFPSGHTAGSVVFYGFVVWWIARANPSAARRAAALAGAVAMVALVAASRIVLGAHYLSDVLAAVVEGCAWLAICLSAPRPGPWVDRLSRHHASHGRS